MIYTLVRGKVKDFAIWKASFDTLKEKRREAGITPKYVLQGIDDPNEITLLLEVEDIARAKAYYDSPLLMEHFVKGGVIGKPEFRFFTDEYEELKNVSGF